MYRSFNLQSGTRSCSCGAAEHSCVYSAFFPLPDHKQTQESLGRKTQQPKHRTQHIITGNSVCTDFFGGVFQFVVGGIDSGVDIFFDFVQIRFDHRLEDHRRTLLFSMHAQHSAATETEKGSAADGRQTEQHTTTSNKERTLVCGAIHHTRNTIFNR